MNIQDIVLVGLALALLARSQQARSVQQERKNYMLNPTTWGSDQWARLYGDDLWMGVPHSAPNSYAAYGIEGGLGFMY